MVFGRRTIELCLRSVMLTAAIATNFVNGDDPSSISSASGVLSNGKDIITNHRIVPFSEELSLTKEDAANSTANPSNSLIVSSCPPLQQQHVVSTPSEKVCVTPGCVLAAASLINSMDVSVDPCQGKQMRRKFVETNMSI